MTAADEAYGRARRLADVGRYADAERETRAGLAESPHSGPLLAMLAWVLRLRRDYAGALAAADGAVAAEPGLADAHAERAENLMALVQAREAVTAAAEAVRLEPLSPGGHLVLARALSAANDPDTARVAAARGLRLAPRSVEALLTVAEVERDAGNRDQATAAAQGALAIDPENAYGRWLVAMLDAERLRVRRSMRALREVARDNPARPDVLSMTWPVRGVLSGLRRGVAAGAVLVCVLVVVSHWWPFAGEFARVLSAVLVAVMAGFALRVLVPAGPLPWRCLRLVPRLTRRATVGGLWVAAVAAALLVTHAATGRWPAALLALITAPVLWALGFLEMLGTGLDDPGFRQAMRDLRGEFREWWVTTKRDLREVWQDP